MNHEFFGILSVVLGLTAAFFYWRSIWQGNTKPHLFSHMVWSLLAAIGAAAQISDNAGPGAWASITTAIICFITMVWAFRLGQTNITRGDWVSLAISLSIIPVWLITDNALCAILLVSLIDFTGFIPTITKSWHRPDEENMTAWAFNILKLGASLLSLYNFSFITAFYPGSFFILNVLFVIMCLARRQVKTISLSHSA